MHLKYVIILNTTIARQTIFNVIIYLFKIFSMHNLSTFSHNKPSFRRRAGRLGFLLQQLYLSFHLTHFLKLQVKSHSSDTISQTASQIITKKLEVSAFDTSSEMVAGAGFEPTTFGL